MQKIYGDVNKMQKIKNMTWTKHDKTHMNLGFYTKPW